ncbi:MAG: ABC transporter ATP-binding protein [Treponema sp.]|nr:ABC transporter ATP-binding protein [Treponema sp.]
MTEKKESVGENEIEIKNLVVSFSTNKGKVHAVRGINLSIKRGETLAIVGESGSGKSVTAKAILGIEAPNAIIESGEILYNGKDILKLNEKDMEKLRGNKITMIFQDPLSSLDPIMKIGPQLTEATLLNGRSNQKLAAKKLSATLKTLKSVLTPSEYTLLDATVKKAEKEYESYFKKLNETEVVATDLYSAVKDMPNAFSQMQGVCSMPEAIDTIDSLVKEKKFTITKRIAYKKAIDIMQEVGIREPEKRFNQYPFEFSGGMRQRIVIAIAIAANPDLLICDEPTTALDVTIQAQILELINRLKKSRGMTVLFITHDLGVVANVADTIAVMYAGKVVESGTTRDIFYSPVHPYTWALLSSMPDLDTKDELEAIPGTPPDMLNPPLGDAFASRNKYAMAIDFEQEPPTFRISQTHYAATWLLHPNAPKVKPPKSVLDRIERMKNREASHAE